MSDEGSAQPKAAAPAAPPADVDNNTPAAVDTKAHDTPAQKADDSKTAAEKPADPESEPAKNEAAEATKEATEESTEKPADKQTEDVEMTDAPDATAAPAPEASQKDKTGETDAAVQSATATTPKNKTPARRKSTAGADSSKGKKLNKKASRAAITHIDAEPGQHFFIKLKGFPQWPCIICDEDMLPHALIKSRPVSAARADGTYREDFADGGKQAHNRSFPIMYLATNEFGWVSNKDLIDLDPAQVLDQINGKMRKDLQLAHELASENHDLDYYKEVLQQFQEELLEKQKAAEAKAAAAATPKSSKKKAKAPVDEDVEMEDFDDEAILTNKKEKKRKSPTDSETPQRSESVKKPKIKLTNNSTPKSNGATPKSAKAGGETKAAKKAKKPIQEDSEEQALPPKEPEMSAEDRLDRKKKEVLFLRHKLQKGLLTRDQQPKEEEMQIMSDYLTKLEGFPDLETEIIRGTKINKVLKALLKLDNIPRDGEFNFKPRCQGLLEKWNKLLASEDAPASAGPEETNGVNGHKNEDTKSPINGVKKAGSEESEAPKSNAADVKAEESKTEVKTAGETPKQEEGSDEKKVPLSKEEASSTEEKQDTKMEDVSSNEEKPKVEETSKASEAVEATA